MYGLPMLVLVVRIFAKCEFISENAKTNLSFFRNNLQKDFCRKYLL